MKAMEWYNEAEALCKRVKLLLVDEDLMSESAQIGSDTWRIYLGEKLKFFKNDKEMDWYSLKKEYSSRDAVWQNLLGNLKTKVTMAESLNEKLLNYYVQPYIKEAVMERLTSGSDTGGDEEILKMVARKRWSKLNSMLIPCKAEYLYGDFPLPSPSENYPLKACFRYNSGGYLTYGTETSIDKELKSMWSFLQHFDDIENTVKRFTEAFKPVIAIINESGKKRRKK